MSRKKRNFDHGLIVPEEEEVHAERIPFLTLAIVFPCSPSSTTDGDRH